MHEAEPSRLATGSLDQSEPLKSRKRWPVRISHQSSLDFNNVATPRSFQCLEL